MPLSPGTRLGSYEITAAVGAGGMGEVYRARDTRLNRDVAIKVLPDAFAADPDRLARFEREAQTLAALNHPNIAHIHGVEESGQSRALVMEFVDGEDLAERLQKGPVPLEEAIEIARQVAEALEAAHERGVIHRDLKPANIKLTSDGTAKVLDFGLAKALIGDGSMPSGVLTSNSPTFTSPAMTHMGVILGTAAYMSPEQAKGKPVDRRADIWALGVVLFEMLTGRLLFVGETVTETIAQVITQPPNFDALPAGTPASVRRILRRCLEKDPRKRFHSAGDVRIELEEALLPSEERSHDSATSVASGFSRKTTWLPWAALAAGVVIVSLAAILKPFGRSTVPAAPSMRLDVRIADTAPIVIDNNVDGALAVISPDGQTVCYLGMAQNTRRLFVRRLDAAESTPLSGTDDALSQFFSPDGKWIAFFAGGELKKVAVSGGAPVSITSAPDARGGAWGPDDTIVFTPTTGDGLHRVSASGGTSEPITTRDAKERTHRWPSFIPGTDVVLFISQDHDAAYDDGMIEAVRLSTKERTLLVRGGTFPRYLAPGYLTYIREGTVFAVPLDPKTLEVSGSAQPVLSSVLASHGVGAGVGDGAAQIAFSDTGTAVVLAGAVTSAASRLVVTDRTGKALYTHPDKAEFRSPRFSPDGSRVAVQMVDGRVNNIFVLDIARATLTKVTFDGTMNGTPTWSRDGKLLAFYSDRVAGGLNLFTIRSDGAGEPAQITDNQNINVPMSFSKDDTLIAGMQQGTGGGFDLVVFSRADGKVTPFAATPAQEVLPSFSPDGQWLAFSSDETGRPEVYVRPYPPQGGRWVLSTGGGLGPVWTKNGHELIYVGVGTGRIFAVDVTVKDGAIQPGKPQMLFEFPLSNVPNGFWMDATTDGSKLVLLRDDDRLGPGGHTHVTLITNFTEQVRKVVGDAR